MSDDVPRRVGDVPPPEIDVPTGWRLVSEERRTPFDVRVAVASAHTRVYEDASLRERVSESTGAESTWRFVFASRLRIRPSPPPSRALTRLVTDRASVAFLDELEARGFSDIAPADSHRLWIDGSAVDGSAVDATRYRARVVADGLTVPVEAYFAAWPTEGEFLLGGGAYPLSLPGSAPFDPERGRDELFEMLGSIR
ncbi:hypothetical protein [Halobellus sp. GM3]|uniref:hypothetical protein n=1 Tax=Halobellus sp. GM3 TaxID=3458410 RepID=UPI00403DD9EA